MSVQAFKLNFPHYDLLFVMKQEKGYCYIVNSSQMGALCSLFVKTLSLTHFKSAGS